NLHAAAAAARGRLDKHGKTDLRGEAEGIGVVGYLSVGAGDHRNAEPPCGALCLDLVAHDADMLGTRADESNVVGGENLRETGILGEEAVAGMDCIGAGNLAGGEDLRDIEVGFARRRRADANALVGEPDMHGIGVGSRVDRDRRDAELLAGAEHAKGDFAAIGDENLFEEGSTHSMIINGSPYSTGWPSSTRMRLTVPAPGAGVLFMVVLASMISSV